MSTHSMVALIMLITSLPAMAPPMPSSSTSTSGRSSAMAAQRGVAVGDATRTGTSARLERVHRRLAGLRVVVDQQHALAPPRAHRRSRRRHPARNGLVVVATSGSASGRRAGRSAAAPGSRSCVAQRRSSSGSPPSDVARAPAASAQRPARRGGTVAALAAAAGRGLGRGGAPGRQRGAGMLGAARRGRAGGAGCGGRRPRRPRARKPRAARRCRPRCPPASGVSQRTTCLAAGTLHARLRSFDAALRPEGNGRRQAGQYSRALAGRGVSFGAWRCEQPDVTGLARRLFAAGLAAARSRCCARPGRWRWGPTWRGAPRCWPWRDARCACACPTRAGARSCTACSPQILGTLRRGGRRRWRPTRLGFAGEVRRLAPERVQRRDAATPEGGRSRRRPPPPAARAAAAHRRSRAARARSSRLGRPLPRARCDPSRRDDRCVKPSSSPPSACRPAGSWAALKGFTAPQLGASW